MSLAPELATRALLEVRGVSKRFGATRALSDVDLSLASGQVVGLVGPNGAGKSTLVGVLTGRTRPDSGTVTVAGEVVAFRLPKDAINAGVIAVPQEVHLPASLTIEQFVALGVEPTRFGIVARHRLRPAVQDVLRRVGCTITPDTLLGQLKVSEQKTVLVAQALFRNALVLLLDEPTAGMDAVHSRAVLDLVKVVRAEGIGVIYVSHRFDEIKELCDSVVVLRDGKRVQDFRREEIEHTALVQSLLSPTNVAVEELVEASAPSGEVPGSRGAAGGTVVSIRSLSTPRLRDFSLDVREGEMVGVAGLPGSGVEDVFSALASQLAKRQGSIQVRGSELRSAVDAVRHGVGFLPASRKSVLLTEGTVLDNLVLGGLRKLGRAGFATSGQRSSMADGFVRQMGLPSVGLPMTSLSGGTQQKVLLGRLLLQGASVIVLEDPTVGVDVPSREALYALLTELTRSGTACIVGSTDAAELCMLCDRVVTLHNGRVVSTLEGSQLTESRLLAATTAGVA